MSKRLTRIASSQLAAGLARLLQCQISAVLNNGKTYYGVLMSFSENQLTLKDTRSHEHTIGFADLYEVVYDLNSAARIKT